MEKAADLLQTNPLSTQNIVILTDALSVLLSLEGNRDKEMNPLKLLLKALSEEHNITLQWVPSHCDLFGNETAQQEQNDIATSYQEERPSMHDRKENGTNITHRKTVQTPITSWRDRNKSSYFIYERVTTVEVENYSISTVTTD